MTKRVISLLDGRKTFENPCVLDCLRPSQVVGKKRCAEQADLSYSPTSKRARVNLVEEKRSRNIKDRLSQGGKKEILRNRAETRRHWRHGGRKWRIDSSFGSLDSFFIEIVARMCKPAVVHDPMLIDVNDEEDTMDAEPTSAFTCPDPLPSTPQQNIVQPTTPTAPQVTYSKIMEVDAEFQTSTSYPQFQTTGRPDKPQISRACQPKDGQRVNAPMNFTITNAVAEVTPRTVVPMAPLPQQVEHTKKMERDREREAPSVQAQSEKPKFCQPKHGQKVNGPTHFAVTKSAAVSPSITDLPSTAIANPSKAYIYNPPPSPPPTQPSQPKTRNAAISFVRSDDISHVEVQPSKPSTTSSPQPTTKQPSQTAAESSTPSVKQTTRRAEPCRPAPGKKVNRAVPFQMINVAPPADLAVDNSTRTSSFTPNLQAPPTQSAQINTSSSQESDQRPSQVHPQSKPSTPSNHAPETTTVKNPQDARTPDSQQPTTKSPIQYTSKKDEPTDEDMGDLLELMSKPTATEQSTKSIPSNIEPPPSKKIQNKRQAQQKNQPALAKTSTNNKITKSKKSSKASSSKVSPGSATEILSNMSIDTFKNQAAEAKKKKQKEAEEKKLDANDALANFDFEGHLLPLRQLEMEKELVEQCNIAEKKSQRQ